MAQEEVTYAEPVLVAQPNKQLNSPKATLRKADNLFQFSDGYNAAPYPRPNRDHFGTLRSQREAAAKVSY